MIVVRLLGGLGNQMFQYAAGRALADQLGTTLVLDPRGFEKYVLHDFGLMHLAVRARVGDTAALAAYPQWRQRLSPLLRRSSVRLGCYTEPGAAHDPRFASLPDGTHLQGYFQSEKYFVGQRARLAADFAPAAPIDAVNLAMLDVIRATESVMVHIRRGDYVTDPVTLAKHGVCSAKYYQAGLDLVRARYPGVHVFLFSNDLAWATHNIDFGREMTPVGLNATRPHLDIHLMSHCRHRIIANSSFSWWGAWLGDPAGTTIAPIPWFTDARIDASDLCPAEWLRLPR